MKYQTARSKNQEKNKHQNTNICILVFSWFLLFGVWLFPLQVSAQKTYTFPIHNTESTINLPFDTIQSITAIDLGGDGTSELVLGSPPGFEPYVYLLRLDGSIINRWLAYNVSFTGGVNVATSDLDADGIDEIITSPATNGGAHVRVFDGYGKNKLTPGFFVAPETYIGSVLIDTMTYKNKTALVTLTNPEHIPTIALWNIQGEELTSFTLPKIFTSIHSISRIDLGGDESDEIVLAGTSSVNENHLFLLRTDGSQINAFGIDYPEQMQAQSVPKQNGTGEYIAVTAKTLAEHTVFTGYGEQIRATKKDTNAIGSILIPILTQSTKTMLEFPRAVRSLERDGKIISIDLSTQRLSYFDDGIRVGSFITSTGKAGYETPLGEFPINNKAKRAYSNRYGLYMPYWMSFIGGLYGIHELPEWPNGYKEGEDHLGTAVSHGCVRLGVGSAEALYHWADIGTPVIVQE